MAERLTLYVDEHTKNVIDVMPRSFSVSAVVRVLLAAALTNEREFDKYMRDHPEAREVKDWLKPKLRKLVD